MMNNMDASDWPVDSDGRPLGACPCGEPLDGHHHWDGYWVWRGRQLWTDALQSALQTSP